MAQEDDVDGDAQSAEAPVETDEPDRLVPYAADFTPTTLGKTLGQDRVLPWILETARQLGSRPQLQEAIASTCLGHVPKQADRWAMAGHVMAGLRGYGLIKDLGEGRIALTPVGEELLNCEDRDRDAMFARHLIVSCNGQRLLDTIRRYTLSNQVPTLEDLAVEHDRHATSKNISSMRAWLARAGIFSGSRYAIVEEAVDRVLGNDVARFYSMSSDELEFILSARILELQTGKTVLVAPDVATLVDGRASGERIRRKALSSYLKSLEAKNLIELAPLHAGQGGARTAFQLAARAAQLTDDQLRSLLSQSQTGFPLSELRPLDEVIAELAVGNADRLGRLGEMLAVHLCLMLGLTVTDWRRRAPQAEIDLIAERSVALSYQRWAVQVKNTVSLLDSDRVDREVGAAAGTGVTHILFVVPRASVAAPALREILIRCTLTGLHVFYLSAEELTETKPDALLAALRKQERVLSRLKRAEAERRASDTGTIVAARKVPST